MIALQVPNNIKEKAFKEKNKHKEKTYTKKVLYVNYNPLFNYVPQSRLFFPSRICAYFFNLYQI